MDEAIAHFQRALEIKPDYAEAHKNLGIALAGAGRLDEAIGHYQKALVLARQQNKAALVEELKARLQACEAGTPHPQP
jgi:Flp pilus assembly protein TadD